MLPMLPMLLISSTHLHLLSPRMLRRPPVRCRILDMDPGSRIQFGFELALYDARREAEECLVVSTCANLSALSLYSHYNFPYFFVHIFAWIFFNVSLFPSLCATLCMLSFPICCARYLISLLSTRSSCLILSVCG